MDSLDRLLPWLRRAGWAYVIAAGLLAFAAWRFTHQASAGAQPVASAPVRPATKPPSEFVVHVVGAVKRPGVYRMGGDTRVIQAVRMAGGPTSTADLSAINLAAPIQDGQQILIPLRAPSGGPAASSGGPTPAAAGPVSLSSATAAQLEALDGIGPALAGRIVAWRTAHGLRSVDDLLQVPGIGPGRLSALRDNVTP